MQAGSASLRKPEPARRRRLHIHKKEPTNCSHVAASARAFARCVRGADAGVGQYSAEHCAYTIWLSSRVRVSVCQLLGRYFRVVVFHKQFAAASQHNINSGASFSCRSLAFSLTPQLCRPFHRRPKVERRPVCRTSRFRCFLLLQFPRLAYLIHTLYVYMRVYVLVYHHQSATIVCALRSPPRLGLACETPSRRGGAALSCT